VTDWRLVADVGGSNARFARSTGGRALSETRAYHVAEFDSFYAAAKAYIAETGGMAGCAGAAIGVAGPVDDGRVRLTNADWTIEAREVETLLGGARTRLFNDLEAVALALPHLRDADLTPVGESPPRSGGRRTMIAVNVGTGFGAAAIVPGVDGWAPHPGEPGHMSLGAADAEQLDLIGGAGSVEGILSGRGVAFLHEHVARRMGHASQAAHCGSSEVFSRAADDEAAAETVRQFSRLFGRIAGDLAVTAGAWGGVYLCGSVVWGWIDAGGPRYFRRPFEDKGPMSERMRDVYTGLISCDDVGLIGLTYLKA